MSITVKVFLHKEWDSKPIEIRRFPLELGASISYAHLLQKIARLFPSLQADRITVAYIDDDGDRISISSDTELADAIKHSDSAIFRIQIRDSSTETGGGSRAPREKPAPSRSHENVLHVGVVCDGCKGSIYGTRYKCYVCPDYDLCATCKGKGYHAEHNMAALETPSSYPAGRQAGYPCAPPGYYCTSSGYSCPPAGPGMAGCPYYDSSNAAHSTSEQQRNYLHHVGEAVALLLEPLGIKVDVDVVDNKKPPSKTAQGSCAPSKEASRASSVEEDQIQIAVAQLKSMGYEDDGGWLTELVKAKKGDLELVLEELHPE